MHHRRTRPKLLIAGAAVLLLVPSCAEDAPSILEPAGPGAERIETLWWVMLWISAAVFAVVAGMLVWAIVRARTRAEEIDRSPVRWGEPFVAIAGVFLPALILGGVFLYSLREMNALAVVDDIDMTIEVEARNWWWEARYPNGAVTANEIHIPVGQKVKIELTAGDVLHSFWVPRLQAKMDLVPGATNEMWLQADEPGVYRGQCAEFCGLQHTNMLFFVHADPADDFEAWMTAQAQDATDVESAGLDVFLDSTCVGCHALRGTDADAQLGPDLTHLASRETLAAGIIPNTRANLARIIVDPQNVKPGITMPPTELTADELEALLDYLESLD